MKEQHVRRTSKVVGILIIGALVISLLMPLFVWLSTFGDNPTEAQPQQQAQTIDDLPPDIQEQLRQQLNQQQTMPTVIIGSPEAVIATPAASGEEQPATEVTQVPIATP